MTPTQLFDLQHLASRLARRAQAVGGLLRCGEPLTDLDEETADSLVLTLGAALQDVEAVESRLLTALAERGQAGDQGAHP